MSEIAEPGKSCGRCGEPIHAISARVAIESGPLHASHPVLELCAGCSDSLERWLARRGRGRPRGSGGGHSHSHSHRHGEYDQSAMFASPGAGQGAVWVEGERGRQIVIALVVLSVFAVVLFLLMSLFG